MSAAHAIEQDTGFYTSSGALTTREPTPEHIRSSNSYPGYANTRELIFLFEKSKDDTQSVPCSILSFPDVANSDVSTVTSPSWFLAIKDINAYQHREYYQNDDVIAPTPRTIRNALRIIGLLPNWMPRPTVSAADDGEIVIEWHLDEFEIVIGIEDDDEYGYTYYDDGRFIPGKETALVSHKKLPSDLLSYINRLKP